VPSDSSGAECTSPSLGFLPHQYSELDAETTTGSVCVPEKKRIVFMIINSWMPSTIIVIIIIIIIIIITIIKADEKRT